MDIVTLPKKGLKKYDYNIDMEKKDLKKLTKDQLIKLLLKQQAQKHEDIIPPPENWKTQTRSTRRHNITTTKRIPR